MALLCGVFFGGLVGGGYGDQLLSGGEAGDEAEAANVVDGAGQPAGLFVDDADGVVGEQAGGAARQLQVVGDIGLGVPSRSSRRSRRMLMDAPGLDILAEGHIVEAVMLLEVGYHHAASSSSRVNTLPAPRRSEWDELTKVAPAQML